ncbi:ethanolamine ammonia-lyase light chain EutC [Streptomyces mirabilis]|nr:ethanolamine ammonia-lyase light chain EutC [Streptomyces mirabilis]
MPGGASVNGRVHGRDGVYRRENLSEVFPATSLISRRPAPLFLAELGRVALGTYLTFDPRPGRTDAERNRVSNIRPPLGLSCKEAARKLTDLM